MNVYKTYLIEIQTSTYKYLNSIIRQYYNIKIKYLLQLLESKKTLNTTDK